MKALILTAVAALAIPAMADRDVAKFTGKFVTNEELCPGFRSPERVYVAFEDDLEGNRVLNFKFYGTDAAQLDVLLGDGVRKAPGATEETKAMEFWETKFLSDNVLQETVQTVWAGGELIQVTTLTLRGQRLTLKYPSPRDGYEECKMDREE